MVNKIKIKKGLDIPLPGAASDSVTVDSATSLFAVVPDDFPGYTWKVGVKAGDAVRIGDPLLYAKEDEEIKLVSPVAGTVAEIRRGERRKIEFVSVERNGEQTQADFSDVKDDILKHLKRSGLFALMRQRPFDSVPFADAVPRDIFITAFDTAPLAPSLMSEEVARHYDAGIKALAALTSGKVYLSVPAGSEINSQYAEVYSVEGPHPAGNVGPQIAAISPVNKGESVWTLDIVTAARIGRLVTESRIDYSTIVALTGPDMANPHKVKTVAGAKLSTLLAGQLVKNGGHVRVISGNALTGEKVSVEEGFLRYPYRQITAIDEGDHADEFMGWASMAPSKYSVKRTFPGFLNNLGKPYRFDARIKGGHRAMIMSGEYDKVFPFDIYPEYLLKAIMAKDIEKMEQLGIYEVAPEDFALPEFVDTSKIELQKVVRDGLDYLRKETL